MSGTILDLLCTQSINQPEAKAILDVHQKAFSYQQLYKTAQSTISRLRSMDISRNDPVAIVLPNGPLMAIAFLSIASGAASAPLNPSYSASEFEFYLTDLNAKAVVIDAESTSPVIEVAQALKIPIIRIAFQEDDFSCLLMIGTQIVQGDQTNFDAVKPTDIGLILHTSGTTSRPKMVPLTQKNLCISAENIRQTLNLTAKDRCLNIMPLFHIHGLMAAVLATIETGGSLVSTPGFYAPRFFGWLDTFSPTWYTAVPTMHQAILNRAQDKMEIIKKSSLRFIRSSSASLAPNVMKNIEEIFGVPVVEAYGMTEAAHQMASNPLPPRRRKPGSVGLPAGPEIAIMHEEQSTLLPNGTTGEIVIRGDNVTLGYLNNPEANAKSFTKGWFRTGDQGYLDEEGYLFISGRLKEIINRGGEKISPREVDEMLISHPGIIQAVTFSVPDESLGENVAAAVILQDGHLSEIEIRAYLCDKLALHKIPNQIVILDEIPKGPTGKIQRIGLAQNLGLDKETTKKPEEKQVYVTPETEIEKKIANVWKKNLEISKISLHDPFRTLGGDSMLATLIHQDLEHVFGVSISLIELFSAGTVFAQSKLIEELIC
jgi:oxalate---CoA ligase